MFVPSKVYDKAVSLALKATPPKLKANVSAALTLYAKSGDMRDTDLTDMFQVDTTVSSTEAEFDPLVAVPASELCRTALPSSKLSSWKGSSGTLSTLGIVTDGLLFYTDPGISESYFNNKLYDISGVGASVGGTFVGAVNFDATYGAFTFTGSNFIQFPVNAKMNVTNNLTLEAWVKVNSWVYNGGIAVLGTENGSQYELVTESSNVFSLGTNWNIGTWYKMQTTAQAITGWRHVVYTFTNGHWVSYVNGGISSSGTIALTQFPAISGAWMNLGMNHPGGDEYYLGQLAAFRIYNKILAPTDVLTNFNAQKARFGL
jgi:hypothetical protein